MSYICGTGCMEPMGVNILSMKSKFPMYTFNLSFLKWMINRKRHVLSFEIRISSFYLNALLGYSKHCFNWKLNSLSVNTFHNWKQAVCQKFQASNSLSPVQLWNNIIRNFISATVDYHLLFYSFVIVAMFAR